MSADNAIRDRRILLVLSLFEKPVSMDSLIEWSFARPVDLWRVLEQGRKDARVAEHTETGPGHFIWIDESGRDGLWREASIEDWQSALVHTEIIQRAIDHTHDAVNHRNRSRALALFRALVNARRPEIFPDTEHGFMRLVVESCALFVHAEWRPADALDRAIGIAEATGDRASLALLLGVRSNAFIYAGDLEHSEEYMTRSCEIAATLDDPEVLRQASIGLALARILAGEFRAGIDAFERLLGNVPQEILPAVENLFAEDGTIVLETVGTVALAYFVVGQPARAIDLLHRAEALGARKGRTEIVQLARLYLGLSSAACGDLEPARRHGQPVLDYWLGEADRPFFAWFAAIMMALVHRADGRPDDARAVLVIGHQARTRAGFPYFFGGEIFGVLEWLSECGAVPIEGLTLETETDRYLGWYNIRMKGLAHLAKARTQRASGPRDEVEAHLSEAETLLRRSGAVLDLATLLEERAAWDEEQGRPAEAERRGHESEALRRSVPVIAQIGSTSRGGNTEEKTLQVVELGRLLHWGDRPVNWGEIAARLCSHLGAERAVIVEATTPPCPLGARGGSGAWVGIVVEEIARCRRDRAEVLKPPRNAEDLDEQGQLLVVPFACRNIQRFGWVGLENRRTKAMFDIDDRVLLDMLGAQVSVLLENATLWQELQVTRARLEQENRYYRDLDHAEAVGGSIVGRSRALKQALALASRVAPTDSTVLITGETGVGKEIVAREIHRLSRRSSGPFMPVHIASLAPGLVASSLFGHERGSFTGATEQVRGRFELADGGTLFLDEVGELGPEEQVRLLRVLQEGTFERVGSSRPLRSNFRLIAATNRHLGAMVGAGTFRDDLFYRLNVFPLCVPPLRERIDDIPLLALFFMEKCSRRMGRVFDGISESDMTRLQSYPWPGNVRELMHLVERAAVLSDGPRLRIPPLAPSDVPPTASDAPTQVDADWVSLAEAERRYIRRVLSHVQGRVTGVGGAAEILGLKPSTLHFRLGKLGLRSDLARSRREKSKASP